MAGNGMAYCFFLHYASRLPMAQDISTSLEHPACILCWHVIECRAS